MKKQIINILILFTIFPLLLSEVFAERTRTGTTSTGSSSSDNTRDSRSTTTTATTTTRTPRNNTNSIPRIERILDENGFETFPVQFCIPSKSTNRAEEGTHRGATRFNRCLKKAGADPNSASNWEDEIIFDSNKGTHRLGAAGDIMGRLCYIHEGGADNYIWPGCTNHYQEDPMRSKSEKACRGCDSRKVLQGTSWYASGHIEGDQTDSIELASDGYGRWCAVHLGNHDSSSNGRIWLNCSKEYKDPMYASSWLNNYMFDGDTGFRNHPTIATDHIRWCVMIPRIDNRNPWIRCTKPGNNPHPVSNAGEYLWENEWIKFTNTKAWNAEPGMATDGKRWCFAYMDYLDSKMKIRCTKPGTSPMDKSNYLDPNTIGEDEQRSTSNLSLATDGIRWCIANPGDSHHTEIRCTHSYSDPTIPASWPAPATKTNESQSELQIAMNKSCYMAGDITEDKNECCEDLNYDEESKTCLAPTIPAESPEGDTINTPEGNNGICASSLVDSFEVAHEIAQNSLFQFQALFRNFTSSANIITATDRLINTAKKRYQKNNEVFNKFKQDIEINKRGIEILAHAIPNAQTSEEKQNLVNQFNGLNITFNGSKIFATTDDNQLIIQNIQQVNHQFTKQLYADLEIVAKEISADIDKALDQAANDSWNCEKASLRFCRPWKLYDNSTTPGKYYISPPVVKADGTTFYSNFNTENVDAMNELGKIKIVDSTEGYWTAMSSYLQTKLNNYVDPTAGIKIYDGATKAETNENGKTIGKLINNVEMANDLTKLLKAITILQKPGENLIKATTTQKDRTEEEKEEWVLNIGDYVHHLLNALEIEIAFFQAQQGLEASKNKCIELIMAKWDSSANASTGGFLSSTAYNEANTGDNQNLEFKSDGNGISELLPNQQDTTTVVNTTGAINSSGNTPHGVYAINSNTSTTSGEMTNDKTNSVNQAYEQRKKRRKELKVQTTKKPNGQAIIANLSQRHDQFSDVINKNGIPASGGKSSLSSISISGDSGGSISATTPTEKSKPDEEKTTSILPDFEKLKNMIASKKKQIAQPAKRTFSRNNSSTADHTPKCQGMSCEERAIMMDNLKSNKSEYKEKESDTIFEKVSKAYMRSIINNRIYE